MSKIFVSYRRNDSEDITGRICDKLFEHFGAENVFQDVDSIRLGDNYRISIRNAIEDSNVLLAVIGESWLGCTDESDARRLDAPNDLVRFEIEMALRRNLRIIPVLVRGATMPKVSELPESIRSLCDFNGFSINSDRRFRSDINELIKGIDKLFSDAGTPPSNNVRCATEIVNSIGMRLVPVSPGHFQMGSPADEIGHVPSEEPQHLVRINHPFWMGAFLVTQEEFEKIMGFNPSRYSSLGPRYPVEQVDWDQAQEFCTQLSQLTPERVAGRRYSLPTEAQWEYACRAGTTDPYSFGSSAISGMANWLEPENSSEHTSPVGAFPPNPLGLYDVHGNLWEWCSDYYNDSFYTISATDDPENCEPAESHSIRGGGWFSPPEQCRSAFRMGWTGGYCDLGFRVACMVYPR